MYEYRQALMRMRQGDSEREIARAKLMGRSKATRFRELARAQGWLDPERPLPEDAEIAAALGRPKLPVTAQSSIAAYRPLVEQWLAQGVSGVVIHTTLKREHGFTGHYSSVRRKRPANPSCRFAQTLTAGCQRCGSSSPILL